MIDAHNDRIRVDVGTRYGNHVEVVAGGGDKCRRKGQPGPELLLPTWIGPPEPLVRVEQVPEPLDEPRTLVFTGTQARSDSRGQQLDRQHHDEHHDDPRGSVRELEEVLLIADVQSLVADVDPLASSPHLSWQFPIRGWNE